MKTLKEWDAKPGDVVTAISMINTGHIIENGSSWIIKRYDGNDYFGVLAHCKEDHKGVRLSNNHLWDIKRAPNVVKYALKVEFFDYTGYTQITIVDGVPQDVSIKWSDMK